MMRPAENAADSADPDFAEVGVDADLDEYGPEARHRETVDGGSAS